MEHRALATLSFSLLLAAGCGFAAEHDGWPVPALPDAAAADAGAKVEPLVAARPVIAPPAIAPVANEAVERVLGGAPDVDAAPARIDPQDFMRIYDVLPAISSDGRLIMTARYETESDSIYVDLVRTSDRRRIRSLPIAFAGDDDGTSDDAIAAVDRILDRRGFVTFRELDEVLPEDPDAESWDGVIRQWTSDDLAVHYDPSTGGLAVYRDYALVHQSLVPAQVPDGPGVGLMDPDYAELPMIPAADDMRISADGTTLAIRLAACDCSCDIEPFWKLIAL
jgi:hypothetical protein